MPRIGFLAFGSADVTTFYAEFLEGLKESGYVEGRNVAITSRWAGGDHDRLPILAGELVALKPTVLVTTNPQTALAAFRATRTIPIVFLCSDPIALGLVSSLNRPGTNATGIDTLSPEVSGKRLELLSELLPSARSVAVLINPGGPSAAPQLAELRAAARVTGHDLHVVEARTGSDIASAFVRLAERRASSLLVAGDPLFIVERDQIAALAARYAIPTMYAWPEFVIAGGLISYSISLKDALRLLGAYTGKILDGARPADLPVQRPTKLELVINLKTAKALGLTIPPAILTRADEVIE
jgi:putative ABC transport system substrate-binding protein